MRKIENDCCACATPAYPCRGNDCPNRNVPHFYCDRCGAETKLYNYDGEELCEECVLEALEVVEGSEEI